MSKQRRMWLKFLLLLRQRRRVVEYLCYRGYMLRDVETRQRDLEGALS